MRLLKHYLEKYRTWKEDRLQQKLLMCYLRNATQTYRHCYGNHYSLCEHCPYRSEK